MSSIEIKLNLPSGKDYLSPSSAKQLAKHPMSYLAYIADKFEPNEGMIFGSYYENFLYGIESDEFFVYDDDAVVQQAMEQYGKPTSNIRATKVYKDLKEQVLQQAQGKHIITEEQHDNALAMATVMMESGVFDGYLDGETQVEKSRVIDTGEYLVKALVRSDVVMASGAVNDLKTTSSSIDGFISQAKKLDYDVQAYLSMEVWKVDSFTFVVQRTAGLFDVGVFTAHRDGWFFESGKRKFNKAVQNYIGWLSDDAKAFGADPRNYVTFMEI